MGRVLCGLLKPDSGGQLDGVSVCLPLWSQNLQNKLSVVFQDYTTANPRFRVKALSARADYGNAGGKQTGS